MIFFWNFGISPATQTFSYKSYRIYTSCYGQPSVSSKLPRVDICTVYSFFADFLPWLHLEWFQSVRPGGIGGSFENMSHAVDAVFYIW